MAHASKDQGTFSDDIFSDVDDDFMVIGDPSRIEWDGDQTAYTPPTPLKNLAFTAKASAKSTWSSAKSLALAAAHEAPSLRSVTLAPHKALLNSVSCFPVETREERDQRVGEEIERGRQYTEMKLAERTRLKRMNFTAYSPEREHFPRGERDEALERVLERGRRRRESKEISKTEGGYKHPLEDNAEGTLPTPALAWNRHTAESVLEADLEDVARAPVFRSDGAEYDPLGVSTMWQRPVKGGSDDARRREDLLRQWREREERQKEERKGTRRDRDGFEEADLWPAAQVVTGNRGMSAVAGV
ncbi:hypothetical protein MMC30_000395 [Trapelia coarctata]|nr:hypothetical protein [Trapelia coarctata]